MLQNTTRNQTGRSKGGKNVEKFALIESHVNRRQYRYVTVPIPALSVMMHHVTTEELNGQRDTGNEIPYTHSIRVTEGSTHRSASPLFHRVVAILNVNSSSISKTDTFWAVSVRLREVIEGDENN